MKQKNRIKVCHLTSAHPAKDGRIFYKECSSLANEGYDVTLIAAGAENELCNDVRIIGVPKANNRLERIIVTTKKVYQKSIEVDADIYHLHDPELLFIGLQLKRMGKIVIFDSHEDVRAQILDKDYLGIGKICASRVYGYLERYVLSRLDAVISVTPQIVQRLTRINPKTELITNFPIISDIITSKKENNTSISVPPYFIFFAGGVSKQWSHEVIIQSLNKTNCDVHYILCGRADLDYIEMLKKTIGWNHVTYLGYLPKNQIDAYYNKCLAGIALNQYVANVGYKVGSLGNTKLFEIMSSGTPVICTDFILWKEIIQKWNCGICVDPSSPRQIADAINYLIDHPEEARKMGENGKKAVAEEFNWSIEEKKLLALYDNLSSTLESNI